MRQRYILLATLLLSMCFTQVSLAQNPKQMKKQQKSAKKKQKAYKQPLTQDVKRKDSDGDGVMDFQDQCINTPKGQPVTPFGCPVDTDFDGTFDTEDACVLVPGPKENKGCPWPDADNDGIVDKDDKCPNTPGLEPFQGCPDTDKDGIADHEDNCPEAYGPKSLQGCPDRDQDGIADAEDKCPSIWGIPENSGCPPIKEEEKQALMEAFANLLFDKNKATIKPSSFESLNKLAEVMNNNPNSILLLAGHTDNVGDDDFNMELSVNRANSVMNYLIEKGVNASRITAKGHGEEQPIATNDTEAGKRKNRRVEFALEYR